MKPIRIVVYTFAILLLGAEAPLTAGPGAVTTFGNTDAQECYTSAKFGHFASDSALRYCNSALKTGQLNRRDKAATLVNRGIIHNNSKNFDLALEDFAAALQINSQLGEAFINRGNTYIFQQRFDDAIEDYTKAIDFGARELHAAYYNRGLAREALKRFDQAYEDYKMASQMAPGWILPLERIEVYERKYFKSPESAPINGTTKSQTGNGTGEPTN